MTSENNNRVARQGPSWAPPAAAEAQPPSPPGARPPGRPLPVSAERVAVERTPLRVADSGGRSQPAPTDTRAEKQAPGGDNRIATSGAPSPPAGSPGSAQQSAREVAPLQPGYSTELPRTRAPAAPRHHGEINRDMLFRPTKRPPASGWRRMVHLVTGGGVNPGESPADVSRRHLVERVNQPIRGDYKIAVLSLKGGVGKTTTHPADLLELWTRPRRRTPAKPARTPPEDCPDTVGKAPDHDPPRSTTTPVASCDRDL